MHDVKLYVRYQMLTSTGKKIIPQLFDNLFLVNYLPHLFEIFVTTKFGSVIFTSHWRGSMWKSKKYTNGA